MSDFLKNTIIKSFNFPVIDNNDLTLIDKIRVKLFTLSVGTANISNINLEDTNDLTSVKLIDGTSGWQIADTMPTNVESYFNESLSGNGSNLNVVINDASGSVSEGDMAGSVINVLGANVAAIQNIDEGNYDCKVIGLNSEVVHLFAKIFNCSTSIQKPANNFDVELDLGSAFKSRF